MNGRKKDSKVCPRLGSDRHTHIDSPMLGSGQSAQSHNTGYRKAKRGANMTNKTIRKSVFITLSHAERREVSK